MATSTMYEILLTVRDIADGDMTTERLAMRRGVGERTIKSYISQARHLGVNIESYPVNNYQGVKIYLWSVTNYDDIKSRLDTWIDLEERGL